MHQPFASQRYNTHWVPLRFVRHYFISVLLSPPAAHYFCSPAVPTSAAFAKVLRQLTILYTWLIRPSFRHAALSSLASFRRLRALTGNILRRLHMELASPFVPHGFTASPSWGLAAAFVRRASSLRLLRQLASNASAPQVFGARPTLLFAAGAFTGQTSIASLIILNH